MTTTVLVPCAGCGDEIDVELQDDGSDETLILADSYCAGCVEEMFEDTGP